MSNNNYDSDRASMETLSLQCANTHLLSPNCRVNIHHYWDVKVHNSHPAEEAQFEQITGW